MSNDPNRDLAEQRLNMGKDPGGSYADLNQKYENQQQQYNQNKQYGQNSGSAACFAGGTRLLTQNGWKQIRAFKKGDMILSYCPKQGILKQREVLKVKVHNEPSRIWCIRTSGDNSRIRTTMAHSFLSRRGWLKTKELVVGDVITAIEFDGTVVEKTILSVRATEEYEETYNLVTSGENNFIACGCVAHNYTYFRSLRSFAVNTLYFASNTRSPGKWRLLQKLMHSMA